MSDTLFRNVCPYAVYIRLQSPWKNRKEGLLMFIGEETDAG